MGIWEEAYWAQKRFFRLTHCHLKHSTQVNSIIPLSQPLIAYTNEKWSKMAKLVFYLHFFMIDTWLEINNFYLRFDSEDNKYLGPEKTVFYTRPISNLFTIKKVLTEHSCPEQSEFFQKTKTNNLCSIIFISSFISVNWMKFLKLVSQMLFN